MLTSLRDSRNFIFLNYGAGKFTESLDKFAWVSNPRGGNVGATASDVDGDGDLDLYFTAFLKRFHTEELGREGVARIEALGEAARAAVKFSVIGASPAVAPSNAIGVNMGRARQKAERCQRHMIGRIAFQPGIIGVFCGAMIGHS